MPPIVAILIWRWMLDTRVGIINRPRRHRSAGPFLASAEWVSPALITIITWNTLPPVTLNLHDEPTIAAQRAGRSC
jgi:ABC-type sugar transport system permease subunit